MATEKEADDMVQATIYLLADQNLADVEDVKESRDNLGLGELATKDSLTSSDVGAYPLTGGNLHENASITLISLDQSPDDGDIIYSPWVRCCLKGRGGDPEFSDGASCLMRVVERVGEMAFFELRWSGFGSVYSFRFDQNGEFHAPSGVYVGDAHLTPDGNVYGSCWGGYLNEWIASKISTSCISGVRLSAVIWTGNIGNDQHNFDDGNVMTGVQSEANYAINMTFAYRQLQVCINGNWVAVSSL